MKLLTPVQNRDLREQEVVREILRTQEVQKVADKARKKMSDTQAEFDVMLKSQRERWITEEEKHNQNISVMTKEVKVLEQRREQALIPIELKIKEADDRLLEADNLMKTVKELKQNADEYIEKLEEKLSEVGEREQDVKIKEQKLNNREKGINEQSLMAVERTKELTRQLIEFKDFKTKELKEIEDKKMDNFMAKRSLEAKKEQLESKEKELADWAVRLKDERGTLERAFKRLST